MDKSEFWRNDRNSLSMTSFILHVGPITNEKNAHAKHT